VDQKEIHVLTEYLFASKCQELLSSYNPGNVDFSIFKLDKG